MALPLPDWSHCRFLGLLLGAVLGATFVAPGTAGAAAKTGGYRLDLARRGDFVAQTNFVQCVGASMQMMLNIAGPTTDRTARTQLRLQVLARSLSGPTRVGFERKGANVRGWASGLNELDAGPYRLVGATSLDEAMRLAAVAIRATGKPVGLLDVGWAPRLGDERIEATADPARTSDFRVTRAIVLDPLYPYGSSRWGASPRPRKHSRSRRSGNSSSHAAAVSFPERYRARMPPRR